MSRILVAALSAIAAVVTIGILVRALDERSAPPIVIEDPLQDVEIVVSVEGAVATPGVYRLPAQARFQDAIDAAGGASEQADLAMVNLARRIRDEDRIVIPARGMGGMTSPAVVPGDATLVESPGGGDLIDINAASAAELEALPGIGPVLAQRIIDIRSKNGPFAAVDDLALVPGVSRKLVDELRPLVTAGP
ncbi:MAG: helix-hairpin-helix domain-containing protein [Chloroflexota bacterium]